MITHIIRRECTFIVEISLVEIYDKNEPVKMFNSSFQMFRFYTSFQLILIFHALYVS